MKSKLLNIISIFCLYFLCAAAARAATFVVTTAGTGAGSFAEAVAMANAAPSDDVITFPNLDPRFYTGGVVIQNNGTLTIQGNGAELTNLYNANAGSSYAVLKISQNAAVILNAVTIQDGSEGIYLETGANLTINESVLRDNGYYSDSSAGGGGIYAVGQNRVIVNNSVIRNNGVSSDEGAYGGAFLGISNAYLEINNSTVNDNVARGGVENDRNDDNPAPAENIALSPEGSGPGSGGAINIDGTLIINDSIINDNLCYGSGGAISLFGTVTIRRSTMSGNQSYASGGTIVGGRVNISDSLISNNSAYNGGGIYISLGTISNTTISGNTARYGGGIRNGSVGNSSNGVTLRNVTITNNTATIEGGGIAPLFADSVTDLGNSIIAGNDAPSGKDIKGAVMSSGFNLIGNTNAATITGDQTGNRLNTDPLLAPLADNGGFSMTHALLAGSPAINNGSNALAVDADGNPLQFDQRGTGFPRIVGNRVDIGAFESQTAAASFSNVLFDFDGDRKADKVVFRPSDGNWYQLLSDIGIVATNFGAPTDKIVPADYDADGKTDIAVFRDGFWYILRSTSNQFSAVQFGQTGDIPVPADYDGDGKADVAVYRPSNGVWYLDNSSAGFSAVAFGISTDKPVPADYDGDGKTDVAVYRPGEGNWYILDSTTGFRAVNFGLSTDKPIPADYDGDGKTDVAVYRDGTWYLLNSTNGFSAVAFGISTDKPVPADYDGDGKTDVAVYRDGFWYVLGTTSGFNAVQFGTAHDVPAPNAFIR